MKFVIKSQFREVVLPPNTPMSGQLVIEESGRSVAPKRTINEAGTIVLQPALEGGETSSYIVSDHETGDSTNYANEHNSLILDLDDTPIKKKRVLPFRPKKFRPEWMSYDMFKDWLRPHQNPERATCIVCDIVLNAGKSELEKHAAAKKHQKKLLENKCLPDMSYCENAEQGGILEGPEIEEPVGASLSYVKHDVAENSYGVETSFTEGLSEAGGSSGQPNLIVRKHKMPELPTLVTKALVTKPAPPWKATAIVNGHVTRLELNDYKGRYIILFFYPQDFSAVCPTEILALSDNISEFRALQTEVVACSVDSHLTHLAWARTPRSDGGLANPKIPLLADPTHSIAKDYGVLLPELGHTLRAHFIIDRRGILRHMAINDINIGRSIEELLRLVQALQHVDETESGCPADWKPGQPTV